MGGGTSSDGGWRDVGEQGDTCGFKCAGRDSVS